MSKHHHHHPSKEEMTYAKAGIIIGAGAATAVTVPITAVITERSLKAHWLEKAKKLKEGGK